MHEKHQINMAFTRTTGITASICWVIFSLFCSEMAHAGNTATSAAMRDLPDLPNAGTAAPAHFDLNGKTVGLGYDSRQRVWGVRLDEYLDLQPSVTLDYGTLLSDRFGAGATLQRDTEYSDVWINGVYALERGLRLRVASGQLRSADGSGFADNNAILQNSYLVAARRHWDRGLLSDLGVTTYVVEANAAGNPASAESNADAFAPGRQQGKVLNLGLQPLSGSRIELRREARRLTYYQGDQERQYLVSNQIHFSQRLDDCIGLQGGYSSTEDINRLDLKVAKNKWYVNLSRTLDSNGNDMSVGIGYTLPLGVSPAGGSKCPSQPASGRGFAPIVDSTVMRPQQFPTVP